MKKLLLSLFSFLLIPCIVSAQQAEDFTATDINGVEHNLFDYLEDGKTVILDVSATWCGPCWVLHQSHKLDYLNEFYGPEGTDDIVVIYFEGDANTTSEDLNGTGDNTQGDWVTGTSYIIIDPETIPDGFLELYAPVGFPTVNVICPETKEIVADIFFASLPKMIEEISTCTDLGEVDEAFLLGISGADKACDDINLTIEVLNLGSVDLENSNVIAKQDGEVIFTTPITQTIGIGETGAVEVGTINLAQGVTTEITYELDFNDMISSNNVFVAQYERAPETDNLINVYIEADEYVELESTAWKIVDDMGNTVIEGPALIANETYEADFELEELGCYSFIMTDDFGDGNFGSIFITDSQGNDIHTESLFGFLAESPFSVTSLSVNVSTTEEEISSLVSVYPTIVRSELTILPQKTLSSNAKIEIYNTVGHTIFSKNEVLNYTSPITLNTSDFVSGTYILSISIDDKVYSTRFVKM